MDLFCEKVGAGPVLVILHGLFGSSTNWRGVAKVLARRYTVLSVDLRNHGKSPHADSMSYLEMAADVGHLIREQNARRCTLIGHSMGGKTAMIAALTEPDLISRLVVADIAPIDYEHDHDDLLAALNGLELSELRSRGEADRALAHALPQAALRNFLLQNLASEAGAYRWRINLGVISNSIETLTRFPIPTDAQPNHSPACFIYGGLSSYLRPEHEPRIRALFPNTEFKCIPDAGHWLHAEKPHAFLENLASFLQGNPDDRI